MAGSFQNEIPKSRINIALNVETNGSQKQLELPMKLLVVGRFSADADNGNIENREKIAMSKTNIDSVMHDLAPALSMSVNNHIHKDNSDLQLNLQFNSIKDFHPENIVNQVPELKRLVAMRNLLKELKANMIDNRTLRTELQKLASDEQTVKQLQHSLEYLSQPAQQASEEVSHD